MKFLISGINGFVASHLKHRLSMEYPDATILGFEIEDDPREWKDHAYDCIFHTAAIARTNECVENGTTDAHISNVELTRILLNEFNYKKFIYTSSCAIYGNQEKLPITEDSPFYPPGTYAAQKLYSENLVHFHLSHMGVPSTCLRLFNTYGEGQSQLGKYPNVLASLLRTYNKHGYVEVTGDGTQTRDFIYISDVVDALIRSMHKTSGNHIYNVCNGIEYSINYLAALISDEIRYIDPRPFDIYRQVGNYDKIKRELGWIPTVSLEEGIRLAIC